MQRVKARLYEAGWMRDGWPERVGGRGGSPLLRTELGAALAARGLADPGLFSLIEVLAPTLIDFAPPALAAEMVPRLLSGEEMWCQGFSEPGTGSDLAGLECRATPDGDPEHAAVWIVNGQKVWTSLAQYSSRCVLLTRTGTTGSRHRGITAFFVDMDTPGITVAPIEMLNGEREFAEVFFDDVAVPRRADDRPTARRLVGGDEHPALRTLVVLLATHRLPLRAPGTPRVLGGDRRSRRRCGRRRVRAVAHGRARSRATQHRLDDGAVLGAETSIDKVLVASAEQAVYDAVRRLMPETVALDDSETGELWRREYLYSRAATIYGGTAEVQRNIIARRLLDLGDDG